MKNNFKSEHSSIRTSLLLYDIGDTSDPSHLLARVEKGVFDCSLRINNFCVLMPHPFLHPPLHLTPMVSNFPNWMYLPLTGIV